MGEKRQKKKILLDVRDSMADEWKMWASNLNISEH